MKRTFADIIYDFKFVNTKQAVLRSFEKTEEVLLDAVAEQMSKGMTGDDKPIVSPYTGNAYYAPSTVRYKKERGVGLGAVTDRITLFQTGRHYKGLYTRISGNAVVIGSNVQYDDNGFKGGFAEFNTNLYQPGTQAGQDYINEHLQPTFYTEMINQLNK